MNFNKTIKNANSEYLIRQLNYQNEEELQILNEKCADYFILIEGRQSIDGIGHELLNELPPDKTLRDKLVFGVYKDGVNLIAVIDIIKDYKLEKEWTIGLLLIDPSERDKGLGSTIHNFLVDLLAAYQANTFRIGVVVENQRALNFWAKLGYQEIDRVNIKVGNRDRKVIVMNYFIK